MIKVIRIFVWGLILLGANQSNAQIGRNLFAISNYKQDMSLSIGDSEQRIVIVSDYGEIQNNLSSNSDVSNYLYQGQEYDFDLDLYFFPSRIYSAKQKRFYQIDPKAQYHSPYVFVQADPVNYIDFNGKEGKPLILFQEDHNYDQSLGADMWDIMEEIPDAHYIPLSTFINGEIGDVPEWNGNVFINSHMGLDKGEEMHVEESRNTNLFKTKSKYAKVVDVDEEGMKGLSFDGEEMGRMLKRFSMERGVPLRNIVAGGCEGESAALAITKGIQPDLTMKGKNHVKVIGMKEGNEIFYAGPVSTSVDNMEGLERTRMYNKPIDANFKWDTEFSEDGKEKFKGFYGELENEEKIHLDYIEGDDFQGLINEGRIPKIFETRYVSFGAYY